MNEASQYRDEHKAVKTAVGDIAVAWAGLEFVLANCVADLLNVERSNALLLFGRASGRQRIQLLKSIISRNAVDFGKDTELVTETLKAAYNLQDERNNAVHLPWSGFDDGTGIVRVKVVPFHDGLNISATPIDPAELHKIARRVDSVMYTLRDVWERHFPDKQSPMTWRELPPDEN